MGLDSAWLRVSEFSRGVAGMRGIEFSLHKAGLLGTMDRAWMVTLVSFTRKICFLVGFDFEFCFTGGIMGLMATTIFFGVEILSFPKLKPTEKGSLIRFGA